MTGETARRAHETTRSRRELLQQLGVAAVGAGAVTAAGSGTARAASEFDVEITDYPEEMVAGQTETITVRITNTGDREDSQVIGVNFGVDRERVELAPDESTTVTLTIETSERDAGNNLVEVSSDDDEDGVRVDMLTPPYLVVEVVGTNGPVVEGRDVEVTFEVHNTGEADGSTTLEWVAEEKGTFSRMVAEDETGVSVSGESTSTQTISFETEPKGKRVIVVNITNADEPDSVEVQVVEELPPTFEVEIVEIGDGKEGEDLEVTVDVTNVGHSGGTKEVTLDLGRAGSTTVEVTAGEAETVTETVNVPTVHGSAGENTLTVRTEDDEVSETVELAENAFFEVDLVSHNSPIPQEFAFEFEVGVTNSGGVAGQGTVEAIVQEILPEDDEETEPQQIGSASANVELDSGASTTVDLAADVGTAEFDTYEAVIDSGDQTVTQEVEVAETGYIDVSDVTLNTPVAAGEDVEVTTTLTNVGSASTTETLSVSVGDAAEQSSEVVLDVDESTEESFTLGTAGGDAGEHTLRVATESASTTQQITINEAQSDDGSGDGDGGGDGDGDGDNNSAVEESDDSAPGFGVGTAIASLGGAGYLLKRRLTDDDE
ncbi:hypothetical protein BRC87_00105 [Halobacteriales archaeon QS_4_66_20]|nr:MAG: hypothetical protein BRC87_00105 [Halobacteriales archaeon QS_4_66_20]